MLDKFNPFKPKLVRFNDGDYGVRKYDLVYGYRFLCNFSDEEFWWSSPRNRRHYTFETRLDAVQRMNSIPELRAKNKALQHKGTAVKNG